MIVVEEVRGVNLLCVLGCSSDDKFVFQAQGFFRLRVHYFHRFPLVSESSLGFSELPLRSWKL